MPVDQTYKTFIEDQLSLFSGFTSKNMFGGVGYFKDELMFGAIMDNVFRLKADAENVGDYEERGMGPHAVKGRKMSMPYYQVPEDVIDNREELASWANKALEAARRGKKK